MDWLQSIAVSVQCLQAAWHQEIAPLLRQAESSQQNTQPSVAIKSEHGAENPQGGPSDAQHDSCSTAGTAVLNALRRELDSQLAAPLQRLLALRKQARGVFVRFMEMHSKAFTPEVVSIIRYDYPVHCRFS